MQQNPIKTAVEVVEAASNIPGTLKDLLLFAGCIFFGGFFKMYKAKEKNKSQKVTLSWILAELVVGLFVSVLVLVILDYLVHLPKLLTYMLCAYAGSLSASVHDTVEDNIKQLINSLFKKITK